MDKKLFDQLLESVKDADEYRCQFLCEFGPDPRDKALHERLAQYYREADTNRKAWSEFRDWCRARGYNVDDINRAKRNHRHE